MEPITKPPIGLMPRYLFDEQVAEFNATLRAGRILSITQAIERYEAAAMPVPPEWITERSELQDAQAIAVVMAEAAKCVDCTAEEFCTYHALQRWPQYKPKKR